MIKKINPVVIKRNRQNGRRKIYSSGFTIIETVLYIAIFSTVIVGLIAFSFEVVKNRVKNQVLFSVEEDSRFAMLRITQELNESYDIDESVSVFGVNPGVLKLRNRNAWKDPTIFDVADGKLRLTYGDGFPVFITSDNVRITNLIFTNYSVSGKPKTIKIDLSAEYINPENSEEYSASTIITSSVTLRRNAP